MTSPLDQVLTIRKYIYHRVVFAISAHLSENERTRKFGQILDLTGELKRCKMLSFGWVSWVLMA